jgi:DNA-binding response OmpR family regulator
MMQPTVAIFNSSADTLEMLVCLFNSVGFRAVTARADDVRSGVFDFIEFIGVENPDVIVWDITPPYDRNWTFLRLLRSIGPLEDRGIVVTTTNKAHLDTLLGRHSGGLEIVGTPYDLQDIVNAVIRAIERRNWSRGQAFRQRREGLAGR